MYLLHSQCGGTLLEILDQTCVDEINKLCRPGKKFCEEKLLLTPNNKQTNKQTNKTPTNQQTNKTPTKKPTNKPTKNPTNQQNNQQLTTSARSPAWAGRCAG